MGSFLSGGRLCSRLAGAIRVTPPQTSTRHDTEGFTASGIARSLFAPVNPVVYAAVALQPATSRAEPPDSSVIFATPGPRQISRTGTREITHLQFAL